MATVYFAITIGTPPFTATIDPAVAAPLTGLGIGTHYFENIPEGNYTITVTDAVGYNISFPADVDCIPGTTTTSTSTSSTTQPEGGCGTVVEYDGGEEYGGEYEITLGPDVGQVAFQVEPYSYPDRFLVYWNNNVVIDTGYRGSASYAYTPGGSVWRDDFTLGTVPGKGLKDKVDPITGNTYPFADPTHSPDNYPVVNPSNGWYTFYFEKTAPNPQTVTVKSYAPMGGTIWNFIVGCPGVPPQSSTTTTSSTSTSSTTVAETGGLETVFIHIPNS